MSEVSFAVRTVQPTEADILVEARGRMYEDMGAVRSESVEIVDDLFRSWLLERLKDGRAIGYVAETPEGEWLGAVTAHVQEVPPGLDNPSGVQHYLLGMWVRPEVRRQGVASALVTGAMEQAKRASAGAVSLMASDAGRLVYERLGFDPAPAMRVFFEPLP